MDPLAVFGPQAVVGFAQPVSWKDLKERVGAKRDYIEYRRLANELMTVAFEGVPGVKPSPALPFPVAVDALRSAFENVDDYQLAEMSIQSLVLRETGWYFGTIDASISDLEFSNGLYATVLSLLGIPESIRTIVNDKLVSGKEPKLADPSDVLRIGLADLIYAVICITLSNESAPSWMKRREMIDRCRLALWAFSKDVPAAPSERSLTEVPFAAYVHYMRDESEVIEE